MKKKNVTNFCILASTVVFSLSGCALMNKASNASDTAGGMLSGSSSVQESIDETESAEDTEGEVTDQTDAVSETYSEDTASEEPRFDYNDSSFEAENFTPDGEVSILEDGTTTIAKDGYRLIKYERDELPDTAVIGAESINIYQTFTDETEPETVESSDENEDIPSSQNERVIGHSGADKASLQKTSPSVPVPETTAVPRIKETSAPVESHEVIPDAVSSEFTDTALIDDLPSEG